MTNHQDDSSGDLVPREAADRAISECIEVVDELYDSNLAAFARMELTAIRALPAVGQDKAEVERLRGQLADAEARYTGSCRTIDRIAAERDALRAQGWMAIETAPKDGLIDIWLTNSDGTGRRISSCYYDRICDEWRTSSPALRLHCVKASCVTHWMPIPEPPALPLPNADKGGV